jgi:predicted RNase H-like nuclease (RuvC/YqgF family)
MDFDILMKVQEQEEEINDLKKEIRELEMELEFMYVREPNEIKYISSLENTIDQLYKKLDSINYENN